MKSIKKYSEAVTAIKEAILRSQYRAISTVNGEQLSLYYGIGRFVSENSRDGFWGTGAIEQISQLLQKELPGLRGFSATNIKKMRFFYEAWAMISNRPPVAGNLVANENLLLSANHQPTAAELQSKENQIVSNSLPQSTNLEVDENLLLSIIRQPLAAEFNWEEFLQIGFLYNSPCATIPNRWVWQRIALRKKCLKNGAKHYRILKK